MRTRFERCAACAPPAPHIAAILTLRLVSSTPSDFTCLPPGARARLVDALCSNTSVLTSTCGLLDATADAGQLVSHRGALKAYCFFLTHLLLAAEAECKDAPAAGAKARCCPARNPRAFERTAGPAGAADKPAASATRHAGQSRGARAHIWTHAAAWRTAHALGVGPLQLWHCSPLHARLTR